MDILEKVFLLAVLKRQEGESLQEVLHQLVNTKSCTQKEGKAVLKKLKKEGFLNEEGLTFKGVALAKEAEAEFTL